MAMKAARAMKTEAMKAVKAMKAKAMKAVKAMKAKAMKTKKRNMKALKAMKAIKAMKGKKVFGRHEPIWEETPTGWVLDFDNWDD